MDTSLIRDSALRDSLEKARGTAVFKSLFEMAIKRQAHHDAKLAERAKLTEAQAAAAALAARERAGQLAAMPRESRRRAIVREVFENQAPSLQDVRHIHSVLAICGMPYDRLPVSERDYGCQHGNMAVDVQAGFLRGPNGDKIYQPVPFGPKARLILIHLCSEAIRQKSPTIEIAETFTAFVRDMGFPDSGGKKGPLNAFKEQLNALAACTIRITARDRNQDRMRSKSFVPIEGFDVWLSDNPDQRSLWPSTVTFGPTMYESLSKHALPVNAKAVRAFAGSSRKLDLYFWLGWRLYHIQTPLHISWSSLKGQFGQTVTSRDRKFRQMFAQDLSDICEVFPKLPLKLDETGLHLEPAGPEVLALPPPPPSRKS